jgi:hypothetical protein
MPFEYTKMISTGLYEMGEGWCNIITYTHEFCGELFNQVTDDQYLRACNVHAHYGFEAFLLQPERASNNQKKNNEIRDTFLPRHNIFGKIFHF